jgi:hypothetical protein
MPLEFLNEQCLEGRVVECLLLCYIKGDVVTVAAFHRVSAILL